MKITILTDYQKHMIEIAEGLNDLMADLEDIRDEAQEILDEKENDTVKEDIRKIDEAIKKLIDLLSRQAFRRQKVHSILAQRQPVSQQ